MGRSADLNPPFGGSPSRAGIRMVQTMALFLETFTCSGCGRSGRRVGDGDGGSGGLCATCSDRATAAAAIAAAANWSVTPAGRDRGAHTNA
jgi:hypothetical protein